MRGKTSVNCSAHTDARESENQMVGEVGGMRCRRELPEPL